MRKLLPLSIIFAALAVQACGGDDNGSNDPQTCTVVCKDANTLTKCNEDGSTTDENCTNGCDTATNKCKDADVPSDKCTADVCKDENTLVKCSQDGSTTEETCKNGCDVQNNVCYADVTYPEVPKSCTVNSDSVCTSLNTAYSCSDWLSIDEKPELYIEHCTDNRRCDNGVCVVKNTAKCGSNYCKDLNTAVECKDGVPTEVACGKGKLCFDRECRDSDIRTCKSSSDCETIETCHNGLCYLKSNMDMKVGDACDSKEFQEYCKDDVEYKCGYENTVETNDCKEYNGCSTILQKGFRSEKPVFNAVCRGETAQLATCTQPGLVMNRCHNVTDPYFSSYFSLGSVCVVGTDGRYVYQLDHEEADCGNKRCNEETGLCNE